MDANKTIYRKLNFSSDDNNNEKEAMIDTEKSPKIGMEFDTEEETYNFYNQYAKSVGFSVRKHLVHKDSSGRILDRTYCCSRQSSRPDDKRDVNVRSHQPESRTGCGAMMQVNGRYTCKYTVVKFVAEHNGHELATPHKVHFLRSHRNMTIAHKSQANDISNSGIAPRDGFTLMAEQVGGRDKIGFTYEDYKNYLRSKRTVEMKIGDTGGVLEYLQHRQFQDPQFFYAIQVDNEDMIANILWIDAQMKADYAHFGDVVCFDTTYRKNKDGRPFALFVGVNHHKQTIIFGAALLYDETASTFVWLFDTFSRAMSGKEPKTILTDQDAAMAKALATKWPQTYHRLCIWHIFQNAAIHLSKVFSSFRSFSKDFSSCIYDYDDNDEWLEAWQAMLKKYELENNDWLGRMFKIKEKWALVYGRETFCADMTTTQRSESMNSVLKKYVSYKHNLLQFFQKFDQLVEERRYQELRADFRNSQSAPVVSFPVEILKHAAAVYTHKVFELFQVEVRTTYDSKAELCGENGGVFQYKVVSYGKHYKHIVTYDSLKQSVLCSCKKFEFAGILCSHALKVFSLRDIFNIPEPYVMKRWTKKVKNALVEEELSKINIGQIESVSEGAEKEMIGSHYTELCSLTNQLVTRAALTSESFRMVKAGLLKMLMEVDVSLENIVEPPSGSQSIGPTNSPSLVVEKQNPAFEGNKNTTDGISIKGWKNKEKKAIRSSKRPMSGLEKNPRGRKKKPNNVSLSNDAFSNLQDNNQNCYIMTSAAGTGNYNEFVASPFLSPLSQEYQVGVPNLNLLYPVEGSSGSRMQTLRNFNEGFQQLTPSHLRQDQQSGTSLTELLQQQLVRPQMNDSIAQSRFEKAGSNQHDMPKK